MIIPTIINRRFNDAFQASNSIPNGLRSETRCKLSEGLNNYLLLKMVKNEREMGILQVESNSKANILLLFQERALWRERESGRR
ncbi:hypothetical protein NC651_001532 [Populus alba x Populus x berolinensis]|nr:hypothetical protein NC651_001532 [Populus alba x Populus x berolinensis]